MNFLRYIRLILSIIYQRFAKRKYYWSRYHKNWYNFLRTRDVERIRYRSGFFPLWIFQRLFMHHPFAAAFEIDYTILRDITLTFSYIYQICRLSWRREVCQNRKVSKEIYIYIHKRKRKKETVWTEFGKNIGTRIEFLK